MQLFSNSSNMVSNSRSIIVIRCSKQNHIRFFCRCHNRIQLFITAINFGIADSKCWGKSCSSPAQQLQSWTNCRKQSIPAVQRYPWTEQTCYSALPVQAVFLLSGIRSKIWQQTRMCNLLTSPFHYHLLPAGTSWELFSSFKHKNSYQMYLHTVFYRTLIIFLHESCRNILILSIFWVNIINSFCCICQAPYISERSMPHVSFGYGTPPRQLLIFCTFTAQDELSHPQTRV